MPRHDTTPLWQDTLGARVDDHDSKLRDKLRTAYEAVRNRAKPIADVISRDLPDFTIHDVTHCDALWEYATLIAGPAYQLTPCEGFVLGCAFLLHDLGMGLAAYPEGIESLRTHSLWSDTVK